MTPHSTLDNNAIPKHGSDQTRNQNDTRNTTQTLICDITPLLKLLYNNNLHTHKTMSTISTNQNTNYQKYKLYTNHYVIKEITNISTSVTCPAQEVGS